MQTPLPPSLPIALHLPRFTALREKGKVGEVGSKCVNKPHLCEKKACEKLRSSGIA